MAGEDWRVSAKARFGTRRAEGPKSTIEPTSRLAPKRMNENWKCMIDFNISWSDKIGIDFARFHLMQCRLIIFTSKLIRLLNIVQLYTLDFHFLFDFSILIYTSGFLATDIYRLFFSSAHPKPRVNIGVPPVISQVHKLGIKEMKTKTKAKETKHNTKRILKSSNFACRFI